MTNRKSNAPARALDLKIFEQSAKKTGFDLEHRVTRTLRDAGWIVLSNRYYLDDHSGVAREIDLVAYRASSAGHLKVYTVLIVSCKKNEQHAWVMMSRPYVADLANLPVNPTYVWTNDKALLYYVQQDDWPTSYHVAVERHGCRAAFSEPRVDIFAFQEMNKTDGAPKNDKNIFESIVGLMKAQAYEIDSLPQRRNDPVVYQFNLISVVDAPLVALEYGDTEPVAREVDDEHYIARYIVNRKATCARIRFTKESSFRRVLKDYDALHDANRRIADERVTAFYKDVLRDGNRRAMLHQDFIEAIRSRWVYPLRNLTGLQAPNRVRPFLDETEVVAGVEFSFDEATVEKLRANPKANAVVAEALKTVYRYTGGFEIRSDDIPF